PQPCDEIGPSSRSITVTLTEKLPSSSDRVFDELPWYRSWVIEQVRSQPRRIFLCLPEIDFDGDPDWTGFFLLWDQIPELILRPGPKSISSITDTLISSGTISIQDNDEGPQSAKDLVFSVLGRQSVCRVEIQWVDCLPCHLELDRPSGRLFVYRYPSFCVASLQQHRGVDGNEGRNSVVYRCAFDRPDLVPWATEEGVTGLLEEVLLSFQCPVPLTGRDEYNLAGDFPHLRSRIVRLNSYAAGKKPRSLRQLWQDRRDSTAWLAFWSVLIFGTSSILIGLVQMVFQILQYVDSMKKVGD
ncbi:uncharacterized protein PODANS_2_5380, partial [Podospora anserina S mat+]